MGGADRIKTLHTCCWVYFSSLRWTSWWYTIPGIVYCYSISPIGCLRKAMINNLFENRLNVELAMLVLNTLESVYLCSFFLFKSNFLKFEYVVPTVIL